MKALHGDAQKTEDYVMNKPCKLISMLLALVLLAGVIVAAPVTAGAAGGNPNFNPVLASGKCGVNENSDVEFYCFQDGSMAVFGNGPMNDFERVGGISTAPWYGSNLQTVFASTVMRKIAVEYGITRIGDYSFFLPSDYERYVVLYNIDIANSVTSIGEYAFGNQKFIQQVVIPPSVTHIGKNAFKNSGLKFDKGIIYYGDPDTLIWDCEEGTDSEFSQTMTVHILSKYESREAAFNTKFAAKKLQFKADMDDPYAQEGQQLERNIAVYYSSVNSHVFGGAAPFVIVGKFDGRKKSVTHGSSGFVSCVWDGNKSKYYLLTDNNTGALNEADIDGTGKQKETYGNLHESLQLKITHEYIGANTVKMIYTLKNTGSQALSNLKLGGTGDIKIGADDFADIIALNQGGNQVGFYMKSTKNYDKTADGQDYATLGFIGKSVEASGASANFFYGVANANATQSAVGAKTMALVPERIFSPNTNVSNKSYTQGDYTESKDSGMSFYWDGISLEGGASKSYAVLFSVYGENQSNSMFDEINAANFRTVKWMDWDNSTLLMQSIKKTETPVYPGTPPVRQHDNQYDYEFSRWDPAPQAGDNDVVYQAVYNSTPRKFFTGHSLTLHGDIGVYFYVDVNVAGVSKEEIENNSKSVRIHFDWFDKTSDYTLKASDYDSQTGFFKARCNVAAAEMAYNIHATAYIGNQQFTSIDVPYTDDYKVRNYGLAIIGSTAGTYGAKHNQLVNLAKAMLDYGAKSQGVFERTKNTDGSNIEMANDGVAYNMQEYTVELSCSDMTEGLEDYGLKYYGSTMVFLTTTSIRHYYQVIDTAKFNAMKNAHNFTGYTLKPNGTLYYFEKADIAAAELNQDQPLTIGNQTYHFTALDFAAILQAKGAQSEKNLGTALYWYNYYANLYYGI